jgi:hypothetical protein
VAEAELFEDAPGGGVAAQGFGFEGGEPKGFEGVGGDGAGGFGGEAAVPVGAGDDEAEGGGAGAGGGEGEADGAQAIGGAWVGDGPAQRGFVLEALAVAGEPVRAFGNGGGDRVAGEGG